MELITVYTNNPTHGAQDGTPVSTGNTQTAPISVVLNAADEETKTIKCAVRTQPGYVGKGQLRIELIGESATKWSIADGGAEHASVAPDDLAFSSVLEKDFTGGGLDDKNYVFWLRASSSSDENPHIDRSVVVSVRALIGAAS